MLTDKIKRTYHNISKLRPMAAIMDDILNKSTIIILDDIKAIDIDNVLNSSIKMPFDNFFIETNHKHIIGVHVYYLNEKEWSISLYLDEKKEIVPLAITIELDRLPRFFINCHIRECDRVIHPSFMGQRANELCMRTPRNADLCNVAFFALSGLTIVWGVAKYMNDTPTMISRQVDKQSRQADRQINRTGTRPNVNIIRINKKSYVYANSPIEKAEGLKRKPPEPHIRRRHIRRYRDKDGNVIKEVWIKETTIKGGSTGRKVYKI